MSSNWETVKLGDVTKFQQGKQIELEDQFLEPTNEMLRFVRIIDYTSENEPPRYIKADKKSSSYVTDEDVVMIRYGSQTAGKVVIGKAGIIANNMFRVIPTVDYLDRKYLYFYLKSPSIYSYLRGGQSSSTMPAITFGLMSSLDIKIPPLQTQKKIAHILSTLDEKIELNRKMNQTLEEMAQTIFKSWFLDFDPVHAKANCTDEAELENIAKKLGISKAILDLFPNEFEESELGMIPKGWEVVKIEEILKRYQAPKRYKKEAVESFGKTVVLEQGVNIILGYHDGEAEFQATEDEPMFIFGDHTCIMKLSTKPFSISENVIPLSGLIRNGYWTYYATYGQQTFQEYRRHWSELIVKEIVMSDKLLCDLFAKQVKPLILKIEQNILENNELAKTRDTLLPKLLSGEIDVSDLSLEME